MIIEAYMLLNDGGVGTFPDRFLLLLTMISIRINWKAALE